MVVNSLVFSTVHSEGASNFNETFSSSFFQHKRLCKYAALHFLLLLGE